MYILIVFLNLLKFQISLKLIIGLLDYWTISAQAGYAINDSKLSSDHKTSTCRKMA